jgi:hypothetical protein
LKLNAGTEAKVTMISLLWFKVFRWLMKIRSHSLTDHVSKNQDSFRTKKDATRKRMAGFKIIGVTKQDQGLYRKGQKKKLI